MQWFREWEGFVKGKDSGKLCFISKYQFFSYFFLHSSNIFAECFYFGREMEEVTAREGNKSS